jgi:hypothetical protein
MVHKRKKRNLPAALMMINVVLAVLSARQFVYGCSGGVVGILIGLLCEQAQCYF